MAVWWVPGMNPALPRAVIYIPGTGTEEQTRQALEHCHQRAYQVIALTGGRLGWDAAQRMLRHGDADVIVTTRGGPPPAAGVEVARPQQKAVA